MNLLVAQVLTSEGSGTSESVMNGIAWCVEKGANVINLSLGGETSLDQIAAAQAMLQEIEDIDDVLVVAAAGNSGVNNFNQPAVLPGVLSVGAVDANKDLATFSTTNYDIELAAPGVAVTSTIPRSFGQLFASYSGTSMACPHVVGVAALVWSHFPWISAKTMREVLIHSAVDLGDEGRDERFGFGLVDAKAAYDLLASGYSSNPSMTPSSSLSPSESTSPSIEPSLSIAPSKSFSPTAAPPSCDGEFLEVIVQTDLFAHEIHWNIAQWVSPSTIGDEILRGDMYPSNSTLTDYQSICLPQCEENPMKSLYRFRLWDDFGDAGATYSILLNGVPIVQSGSDTYTKVELTTFSTCGTNVLSATLTANPAVALSATDKMSSSIQPSKSSKSSKSSRSMNAVTLEPLDPTDPRQYWLKTKRGYLMNFHTLQCLQNHRGKLVMRECEKERYHLTQSFVLTDDKTILSLAHNNLAISVSTDDSSVVLEEYISLGTGPHERNLWNIEKFLRVRFA
ncbi:hypothetical protein CTEN210_00423 [Chaetoceros tenuissimus]|uniref:subtilisin n=1 Tax=Chaetoceros tenuissimus TaxID=426638 RepID=A0AAD3CFI2_9STRA|nr:hypothetical protein CTEN210_00423 [Chaetoceros tenuissimus]